jgi:hypothetical protein
MKPRRPRALNEIRNPWLRRAAIITLMPLFATAGIVLGTVIAWTDLASDIQEAWRGPRGR